MTLAAAFRAAARGGVFDQLPDQALEILLASLSARGQARWPELRLEPEQFAAELAVRVESLAALEAVHAEELHLAVACARGVRGALAAFDAEVLGASVLAAALRRIDPSPAFVDEVRQIVRERLFVPAPGRIAKYSGLGSLAAWTRVTALRIALDLRPQQARHDELSEGAHAVSADPELRLLQQRYGKEFEAAVSSAFSELSDEQHNLLRLQLVKGLSTAQIASLFGVDRSTIKRRLAGCREVLLEQTAARLRAMLGLSPESFASLARLLTSQLHLSVARLLQERGS